MDVGFTLVRPEQSCLLNHSIGMETYRHQHDCVGGLPAHAPLEVDRNTPMDSIPPSTINPQKPVTKLSRAGKLRPIGQIHLLL